MLVEAYVLFFLKACLELNNCCHSNPIENSIFFNQTIADNVCKNKCKFRGVRQNSICLINCVHREMKYYTKQGTPSANAVDLLMTLSNTYYPDEGTDELCLRMTRTHTVYKGKAYLDGMMKTLFCYWKLDTVDNCPKRNQKYPEKCSKLKYFLNKHTSEVYAHVESLVPCLRKNKIVVS